MHRTHFGENNRDALGGARANVTTESRTKSAHTQAVVGIQFEVYCGRARAPRGKVYKIIK